MHGKLSELQLEVMGRNMGFMLLPLEIQPLACRLTNISRMCLSLLDINLTQPGSPTASFRWISEGKPGLGLLLHHRHRCRSQGLARISQTNRDSHRCLFSELIPTQAVCRYTGKGTQGRAGAGSSSRSRLGSRPGKHRARPTEGTLRG